MTKTLSFGYSSESTQRELSNEYPHERHWMIFKNLVSGVPLDERSIVIGRVFKNHCVLVLWMKVTLALEELN